MGLSNLMSQAGKLLNSDAGKALASSVTKKATSSGSLDLTSLIGLASKNTEIVDLLGNLGVLKKTEEPDSSKTQKIVKQLYSLVKSNIGKIDNDTFKTIINKLLASDKVKKQIEKIAGSGTTTFIKNAITAYLSK